MRITAKEKSVICQAIHALDSEALIYLFGSQVDDQARGGDIDLLILSDTLRFQDLLKLRRVILDQIGWQQLDILIKTRSELNHPFVENAIETGLLLK